MDSSQLVDTLKGNIERLNKLLPQLTQAYSNRSINAETYDFLDASLVEAIVHTNTNLYQWRDYIKSKYQESKGRN